MVSDTKYLEICHDESFVDIDLLFFKVRIQGGSTKFTHSFIEKPIKEWVNLIDPPCRRTIPCSERPKWN